MTIVLIQEKKGHGERAIAFFAPELVDVFNFTRGSIRDTSKSCGNGYVSDRWKRRNSTNSGTFSIFPNLNTVPFWRMFIV